MSRPTNTAVLVSGFRRPDCFARVLAAVGAARPPRLYLAFDVPRPDAPGEAELCAETRAVAARAVDWPCEVRVDVTAHNVGPHRRISSAIDWVFAHEERAFIFEDDCVPHPDFFPFADELLERYADDERVAMISGNQFVPGGWDHGGASYAFVRLAQIWGWATWRRAWKNYDFEMAGWPEAKRDGLLGRVFPRRRDRRYWTKYLDRVREIKTWDYQWCFMRWRLGQAGIVPTRNLTSNIGFGAGATHCHDTAHPAADVPLAGIDFPLRHPTRVAWDDALDARTADILFSEGGWLAYQWAKLRRRLRALRRR